MGRRRARATPAGVAAAAQPLFRFGVIADVQYADQDDAFNFTKSRLRRYRQALALWEQAVSWWREEDVAFIVQLGDFLDGANRGAPGESLRALKSLLRPLENGPPAVHLVGNHELYNFTRSSLETGIKVPGVSEPFTIAAPKAFTHSGIGDVMARRAYYSFSPQPGWRICVLDPYDVSLLTRGGGRPGIEVSREELEPSALALCQAHNPNDIAKDGFAEDLPFGPPRRWVPLNGAVGEVQLHWLRETLRQAQRAEEHTVLLSHVVLHPDATPSGNGLTLLWNYEEVLRVLREAPKPPVAVLCGHAHLGEYTVDEVAGTHHLTFASPLEVPTGGDASGVVEAYADGTLRIRGRGAIPDFELRPPGDSCSHISS